MKTCDKCKNWISDGESWKNTKVYEKYKEQGECKLFGDSNDFAQSLPPRNDVCYGWDYESYKSGVVVMAKFGCINWVDKAEK